MPMDNRPPGVLYHLRPVLLLQFLPVVTERHLENTQIKSHWKSIRGKMKVCNIIIWLLYPSISLFGLLYLANRIRATDSIIIENCHLEVHLSNLISNLNS